MCFKSEECRERRGFWEATKTLWAVEGGKSREGGEGVPQVQLSEL